ncbi:Rieske [2Fe-2S] iron-sulfur domain [Dillenia turbinata]|uniref:Rieske [2Fe-2S] iron-sulfur domain n=1 Tax=Dillenia turbinata TaxID=194707 RepID=A0AAN8UN43_9MAGN
MEAIRASIPLSTLTTKLHKTSSNTPIFNLQFTPRTNSSLSSISPKIRKFSSETFTALSPTISTEPTDPSETEVEIQNPDEKFDWYAQWYPIMPVCDLDKRVPHGKRVMGIDVVVWWDRNENQWKVFDDCCPHRLAPLSEGRIDQWGRLQCVYHGWCFNGAGDCKFIPQAAPDGPPVHTFKKACVAPYPSIVQHDIVWFLPNTDPQYKDIHLKKRPPYIPELEDPLYTKVLASRDIHYGYEVLIENLMDPAHVPYSHYGIMHVPNREGGRPLEISVQKLDVNGFTGKQESGVCKFLPPCVFFFSKIFQSQDDALKSANGNKEPSSHVSPKKLLFIFFCIPVSPGKSRLIWTNPRNFGVWIDRIVPQWVFHVGQNLLLDSDLYLLHLEEHKIMEVGPSNWLKACFVPTKADALVVGFRQWLNKYAGGQVDWRNKFTGALPPTPPREQLMDRYWSHVVNCRSCTTALKGLNVLEAVLQFTSVALIGFVAAAKHDLMSAATRTTLVCMAVLCFGASKWLSQFIYKTFHYHDYSHALK